MRLALSVALALSGSILLHGAGMLALPAAPDPRLAGGEAPLPPALGDSFADMAQGMAEPVAPAAPLAPAPAQPVQPAAVVAAVATPALPDGLAPVRPEAASPAVAPAAALPAPVAAPKAPPPETLAAAIPPAPVRPAPRPAQAAKPAAAPKQAPLPDTPKAKPRPGPAAPKGGETAARTGTATGNPEGAGNRAAGRQQAQGDGGQATEASYGRAVMRRISATRKKTTSLRGKAIIAFSIGAGGQLASVHVARSSGSADLDALGLDHIRRAAPFPPPPSGHPTRFSVEFVGR